MNNQYSSDKQEINGLCYKTKPLKLNILTLHLFKDNKAPNMANTENIIT